MKLEMKSGFSKVMRKKEKSVQLTLSCSGELFILPLLLGPYWPLWTLLASNFSGCFYASYALCFPPLIQWPFTNVKKIIKQRFRATCKKRQ